jgi:hypothetical protein
MNNNPARISLVKAYQVRHWMRELHCTERELSEAFRAVGAGLAEVRAFVARGAIKAC